MGVVLTNTSQQLVIQWVFFGLCVLAFTIRAYIRFVCFRRLLWEDFLMLLALACHLSVAVLGTLYLGHVYELIAAQHGGAVGPDFFSDALTGLKAFGTTSVLSLIGIWLIKFNFLLFFYRLGHHIRGYRIFWWVALIFNIGCGAGALGLLQYPCMFGDLDTIFVQCATVSNIKTTYVHVVMTAVVDVISDIIILMFPAWILWTVKVSLRKKILLGAMFGLVGFTIAVTIVRGSIYGGTFKPVDETGSKQLNTTWIWFWFNVEFTVSFVIACIVSFRALFVNRPQQQQSKQGPQPQDLMNEPKSWQQKKGRGFHDSILDTCRTLEGAWDSECALMPTSSQSTTLNAPSETQRINYSSDDSRHDYSMHNRV